MKTTRLGRQPDLFPTVQPDIFDRNETCEALPDDVLQRIREELDEILSLVQKAEVYPWQDLTKGTLTEIRYRSMAPLLPPLESRRLLAEFAVELKRLYGPDPNLEAQPQVTSYRTPSAAAED